MISSKTSRTLVSSAVVRVLAYSLGTKSNILKSSRGDELAVECRNIFPNATKSGYSTSVPGFLLRAWQIPLRVSTKTSSLGHHWHILKLYNTEAAAYKNSKTRVNLRCLKHRYIQIQKKTKKRCGLLGWHAGKRVVLTYTCTDLSLTYWYVKASESVMMCVCVVMMCVCGVMLCVRMVRGELRYKVCACVQGGCACVCVKIYVSVWDCWVAVCVRNGAFTYHFASAVLYIEPRNGRSDNFDWMIRWC